MNGNQSRLDAYERKRDRARTPEPFGRGSPGERPRFVVHRHAARSLHDDLRLERDGALASWAVPKGVPLEPGGRALAVRVEDHPLSYATFEGEIPAGQYGAGTVEIWDSGSYELLAAKPDGGLEVRLDGRRLRGVWALVPACLDGKEQNWLLVRVRDDRPAAAADLGYRPMLATSAAALPRHGGWLYEVKLDGYRALAHVREGDCLLRSRRGVDLSERFASVAAALARAAGEDAVIDGEVCALDERGRPSFSAMQQHSGELVFYAFDCLELAGSPLLDEPIEERRSRLVALLRPDATVRLSETFADGEALFEAVVAQGLEGIMAKRAGSRYEPGRRSPDWLKIKRAGRQEFVVAGYLRGKGARAATFGSLVLAVNAGGELRYVGKVGTGFGVREQERLLALLRPLERGDSPFRTVPRIPGARAGDLTWVEPRLVVEIAFSEWTHEGHLRQPSYQGTRDDKPAAAVRRERPAAELVRAGRRELRLTNLDKPFWPEEGIAKGDLVDYYRGIAAVLLPHLRRRPVTMRRFPDGAAGKGFFQKNAPAYMPEWIERFRTTVTRRGGGEREIALPVANDELSLLWMVNTGCIEMHPWLSRVARPDRPDVVLFDLDPAPGVPWAQTIELALLVKELLDGLGLASFPKTSGGMGFHILVPLDRRSSYEQARRFAELVAGALARAHPALATTQWAKAHRRGVLIDANQNAMGKTVASAYSVRPRPGAPVSAPLSWEEVDERLDPAAFTMGAVLDRVAARGDLHEGVLTTRQSLAKALRAFA